MGNCSIGSFRHLGTDFERMPDRTFLSFREWFTYNPYVDTVYDRVLHWSETLRMIVFLRVLFILVLLATLTFSVLGVVAAAFGSTCSNDTYDCEGTYFLRIMAFIHAGLYFVCCVLMLWPAAWYAARIRDLILAILLVYPVAYEWVIHIHFSQKCHDYYEHNCHSIYLYHNRSKFYDLCLLSMVIFIEILAVANPEEDGEDSKDRPDLSVVDYLFGKENAEWRRPLLVSSKVKEYSGDISKWREVVHQRNKSLESAVEIADKQQQASSEQAKLLGKYSNLINETTEKVSRASSLLDKQSTKIGELNDAVNDVIKALGSSADISNIGSAFSMTGADCRAWALVIFMCLLVGVGILVGLPKWLHLFHIELGIDI